MQRIPIDLARPGMRLAKPINSDRGMTLCGAGTELSEELISRLLDMGVKRISVEGHPVDMGDKEKGLEQQIQELHARFKAVEADPLMRKIKNMFLRRLEERTENE
jgi:hypothetical protein